MDETRDSTLACDPLFACEPQISWVVLETAEPVSSLIWQNVAQEEGE